MNKFLFSIFAFFLCSIVSHNVSAQGAPSISSQDPSVLRLVSDLDAEAGAILQEEKSLLSLRDQLATDEDKQIFDSRYKDIQRRKDNLQSVQNALNNFRHGDTMPQEAVTAFNNHLQELKTARTELGVNATPFYTGATPGTLDSVTQGLRRDVAKQIQEANLALMDLHARMAQEAPGTVQNDYLARIDVLQKKKEDLLAIKTKLDQVADLPDNPNKAAVTNQARESLDKLAAVQQAQPNVAEIQRQLQSEIESNHSAERAALALRENAKTDAERRIAEEQYRKTQSEKDRLQQLQAAFDNSRNYVHTEQGARIVTEVKQALDELEKKRATSLADTPKASPGLLAPQSEPVPVVTSLEELTGAHRLAGMEKAIAEMEKENAMLESSIFLDVGKGIEAEGARAKFEEHTNMLALKRQEYEEVKASLEWLAKNPDHVEAPGVLATVNKKLAQYDDVQTTPTKAPASPVDLGALKDANDKEITSAYTDINAGKGDVSSELGINSTGAKKGIKRERAFRHAEHRRQQAVRRIDDRNRSRHHSGDGNLQPSLPGLRTGH